MRPKSHSWHSFLYTNPSYTILHFSSKECVCQPVFEVLGLGSDAHWHNTCSEKCFSVSQGGKDDTVQKLLAQLFVDHGFMNLSEDIAVSSSIALMGKCCKIPNSVYLTEEHLLGIP